MNNLQRSGWPVDAPDEVAVERFGRILGGILIVAFVLRIAMLVFAECKPDGFDYPDSHRYVQVARNIAAGEGPIDSPNVRSGTDPLYPAILALGIRLGLNDSAAILRFGRIVNTLCALTSIVLLALLGRRLIGSRAAIISSAILAIDPILLFFNGLVLTESLYITLLLAGVYFLIRLGKNWTGCFAILSGLALGLGTLTRSTNLLLPVVFLPFVGWFVVRNNSARPRAVMMFILGVVFCLAPTVARNHRLLGHFIPVRTGAGASLLEALGPWADGGPGLERIQYPPVSTQADEYVRDRIYQEAAIDWIRDYPGPAVRLAWAKLMRTWSVTINAPGYSSPIYKLIGWLTVAPVYVLAMIGVYVLRKRSLVVWLLLMPAIYFSGVHMVFVGSVRYRLPAMPFLFLLAGAAIDCFWRSAAARSGKALRHG